MSTMWKRVAVAFLALSLVMLASHAIAQSPSPSSSAPDVNGTWSGTTVRGASTITLVLKQQGDDVTGTLTGAGADVDGPVTGKVQGNTLRLKTGTRGSPMLNVKGNEITGVLSEGGLVTLRREK